MSLYQVRYPYHRLTRLTRLLSLALFLACRGALRALLRFKLKRQARKGKMPVWQGYGEILSQRPWFFHYVMFQAPRWNCHGVIGVLPAFAVTRQIRVDLAAVRRSAQAWTLVVYAGDADTRTVAALGPDREAAADGFFQLDLEPGEYRLGARYYACRDDAVWPEVWIDGRLAIPARPLGREAEIYQDYLASIRGRSPCFYRWVHHHIFAALAESGVPTAALERQVLPVGNPDTLFRYGLLPGGASLRLSLEPVLRAHCLVYFTVLNRASLPLYWCRIANACFESPRFTEPVLYLIRIQSLAE